MFGISVVESSGEEKAAAAKESRAHSIDEHHRRLGLGHSAGAGRHSLMRAHFPADFQQRVSESSGAEQRRTEQQWNEAAVERSSSSGDSQQQSSDGKCCRRKSRVVGASRFQVGGVARRKSELLKTTSELLKTTLKQLRS